MDLQRWRHDTTVVRHDESSTELCQLRTLVTFALSRDTDCTNGTDKNHCMYRPDQQRLEWTRPQLPRPQPRHSQHNLKCVTKNNKKRKEKKTEE
ncbi:hypothetical protein ElyMa_002661000 [Elysia marginata]|uniref:Uncharacterized protein n=1 Tax=Elysia marginata TaxID=1093978 RepID=A0AAV4HBJ1_9GAST|nr:hypothetical protein ElyMa_002661000 [Elysia marginata]